MIAAVTAEIDGPDGWLGRALGPQTLELSLPCWTYDFLPLPFPPLIEVTGLTYLDVDGVEQTLDTADWSNDSESVWLSRNWRFPALAKQPDPIRLRYRAGYNGVAVKDGGTGPVPAQVKQAIILSVQHIQSLGAQNLFIRADEVDGIGRREYTVSDQAGAVIRKASERLLSGLRRYV